MESFGCLSKILSSNSNLFIFVVFLMRDGKSSLQLMANGQNKTLSVLQTISDQKKTLIMV